MKSSKINLIHRLILDIFYLTFSIKYDIIKRGGSNPTKHQSRVHLARSLKEDKVMWSLPKFPFWKKSSQENQTTVSKFHDKKVGIYLGPIGFNLVLRPIASLLAGTIVASLLWLPLMITVLLGYVPSNPLNLTLLALLALAMSLLFILPDTPTTEKVPEAHAAMLTFLGERYRWYRTEGEYNWTGKRLFLGRSTVDSQPGTDKEGKGFNYLSEIPIRIWNSANSNDDKVSITCVARNSNSVKVTLTIVLELFDPYLWISSQDPLGDVAERARATFRTAIAFFVSTDVAGVKSVLSQLMGGKTIVTAFLQKSVGMNSVHSLLEDRAGVHQYVIVGEDKNGNIIPNETVEQAKARFLNELNIRRDEFSDEMWNAAADRHGRIIATDRSVAEALDEVANAVGANFLRASVGNITLSEKEELEANNAASEVFQRESQVASAETLVLVREKLQPTAADLNNPYYQDALMIAAAQDNKQVKVVHVTGAQDKLSKAAAVHANSKGDNS